MSTALFPQIEKVEGQPAHLSRLPRVRVAQIVMDYMAHGWSPEELCRRYDDVKPGEAHAAMAYYYDHQDEIDAEIRAEAAANRAARAASTPTPFEIRMRQADSL